MPFSLSPWFFLPIMAAGLWLAYKLYFATPVSRRWRWILGGLTVLAWFVFAGLLLQPLWTKAKVIYHAPVLVLAVDQSPSYAGGATLHSGEAVQKSVDRVRKFYTDRGFQIVDWVFGEKVHPANSPGDIGLLTSLEVLRHQVDSVSLPNLQGIFVWTDGRINKDLDALQNTWPAPLFPVAVPAGNLGEAQGEKVQIDFSNPDSGADVEVEWRPVGVNTGGVSMELREGLQTLWKGELPNAAGASLDRRRYRFHAPHPLRIEDEKWTALIRPDRKADNATEKNDTIPVHVVGLHRSLEIFSRPLHSLEERGLVDALFASDSLEASVVSSEMLETGLRGDAVLWTHAATGRELSAAKKSGAPVIHYRLPGESFGEKTAAFTSAARVAWREDAAHFLPGEVLSLADLGVSSVELPLEGTAFEPIAWAEEGNHRGLLFFRRKKEDGNVFEFIAPAVWASGFSPIAEDRTRKLQQKWVQGIAGWTRWQKKRVDPSQNVLQPDPVNLEMSRLGIDLEKLSELALSAKGQVLYATPGGEFSSPLPDLPKGQSQENLSDSHPVFPMLGTSWIVILLLCLAWAVRKKIHLD